MIIYNIINNNLQNLALGGWGWKKTGMHDKSVNITSIVNNHFHIDFDCIVNDAVKQKQYVYNYILNA